MAYTTIDDPSAYFQTALHSSSNSATITNDGNSDLQPDLIWSKSRNQTRNHALYDSSRGVRKYVMSNLADVEATADSGFDLTSFNSDGFSTGNNQFNVICGGDNYVAWQWKANGGTTSSNTDGSITSTVQANTTAGFSIVTYTGTGSATTIGHGLGAVPSVMIVKNRSKSSGEGWMVYHHKNTSAPETDYIQLHSTNGTVDNNIAWNDTAPTSTVFSVNNDDSTNDSGETFVGYFFTEIQGYSKFGSYTGNAGEPNGPFVYLGFKPAWLMIKASSENGQAWFINDSKRDPTNEITKRLFPNLNSAEGEASGDNNLDYLSNGFKITTQDDGLNKSGVTYIYMAFAEHPFVSSEGVPTTAR